MPPVGPTSILPAAPLPNPPLAGVPLLSVVPPPSPAPSSMAAGENQGPIKARVLSSNMPLAGLPTVGSWPAWAGTCMGNKRPPEPRARKLPKPCRHRQELEEQVCARREREHVRDLAKQRITVGTDTRY
eukprot:862576-Pelagomonas_calceolata.AAC.8